MHILFNPFILGGLLSAFMGNISLGIVSAAMTLIIWGNKKGNNFITIITIMLVVLTGNINFELIFIFVLSLAYLIKEKILPGGYIINGILVVGTYPVWTRVLGLIPVSLLNEINIAGQSLVIAGLLMTLLRGCMLTDSRKNVIDKGEYLLVLLTAIIGLRGSWLAFPCWFLGSLILYFVNNGDRWTAFLQQFRFPDWAWRAIIGAATIGAGYYLLPVYLFPFIVLVICIFSLSRWSEEKIPLIELVYLALVMGIIGGRLGLLI